MCPYDFDVALYDITLKSVALSFSLIGHPGTSSLINNKTPSLKAIHSYLVLSSTPNHSGLSLMVHNRPAGTSGTVDFGIYLALYKFCHILSAACG